MSKNANIFYLIFILTIILIRIWIFWFPLRKIIISGIRINHFWVGVILISFLFFISKSYHLLKIVIFSIGLGVITDELVFMIIGNRTINDYWSIYSVFSVIIVMVLVFVFRKRLIKKLYENSN